MLRQEHHCDLSYGLTMRNELRFSQIYEFNGENRIEISSSMVFQKVKQNVVELVTNIWLMLLHTLRGQYEAITGEPEVIFRKQQHFQEIWKKAKVFTLKLPYNHIVRTPRNLLFFRL